MSRDRAGGGRSRSPKKLTGRMVIAQGRTMLSRPGPCDLLSSNTIFVTVMKSGMHGRPGCLRAVGPKELGNYAIAKPTPLVICSSELFRFVLSGNSAHPCKVWIHRRRARGGARNERPDPYRAVCGPVTPRPQTPIMYIMSGTTVWCIRREPPNGNELPAAQRCRQRRRS